MLSLSPLCYTSQPAKGLLFSSSPSQAPAAGNSCWDPGPGCSAASPRAVAVPWVLLQLLQWYFRQRCRSGRTGRKSFQCQHRDLFGGSSWGEEPNCSFCVCVLPGGTTQTAADPLSSVRKRSSCWNISSLCPVWAFQSAPDNAAALQGEAVSQQLLSALLLTKFLCPPTESCSLSSGIKP